MAAKSAKHGLLATFFAATLFVMPAPTSAVQGACPDSSTSGGLYGGVIFRLSPTLGDPVCELGALLGILGLVGQGLEGAGLECFDGRYWLQLPGGGPLTDEQLVAILDELVGDVLEYVSPNYVNEHPESENLNSFAWGGDAAHCPLSGPDGWQDQPAWQAMNFEQAHALASGENVLVAVIDSGVWHGHPLMQGRIHAASEDLLDDGQATGEALGHGTHVAGIVALAAPGAQILDLRVLDACGRGHDFYTAKAVWMAVNSGARIINLSLGSKTEQPPILEDVFDYAAEHDVLITGAAGNVGENIDLQFGDSQYPAAERCALGVAAVDGDFELAGFSNFADWVILTAPGESIYSALHERNDGNRWGCWSGTSMATPFVAGTAALMRQANPALTAPEIAAYLAGTATVSATGGSKLRILNPPAAVESAVAHQALPVFSPLNQCDTYFGGELEQQSGVPGSTDDDASQHYASGVSLSADLNVLGVLGDNLEAGPIPEMQVSGSTMFAHSESLLELDVNSPLGLIELSAGPLGLDALFVGPPGPSATAAEVAELSFAVRLLDVLSLGDLLEVTLTADAIESSALIEGACGDLQPSGHTHIANGTLTASLLGAIGVPLPIEAQPPPNTGIDLDVLGLVGSTLYLNEQIIKGDGAMESSIQVNALRLALNVDISIIVPVATVNVDLVVGRSSASRNCNTVDVETTLSADPDPGVQGETLTYTATASNNGPESARGTRAVFTRPDSTDFVSAEAPGGCVQTRFNQMTCILGDLPAGTSAGAAIAVTPHFPGEVLARVEMDSAEFETDPELHVRELVTTIGESEISDAIFSDRFEPAD